MLILTVIVRLRILGREIIRLCVRVSERLPKHQSARTLPPLSRRLLGWALRQGRAPPA